MFENLDKIENVITGIFTQISLNKLSNFHDLNVLAENVFMYVLNDCFDYHLQNANILNNVPNQVGFDLIDTKNKIIIQVSSNDSINKITETIEKVKDNSKLKGYHLQFFILATTAKHHKSGKIKNLSDPIIFDKGHDILDGNWLFAQFSSHLDRITLIEKHLELLFNGDLSYEMILNLLHFSENICDYSLPEHYLARKFVIKSERSEAFDVLFDSESNEYSLDKMRLRIMTCVSLLSLVLLRMVKQQNFIDYITFSLKMMIRVYNLLRHHLTVNLVMVNSLIFYHVD